MIRVSKANNERTPAEVWRPGEARTRTNGRNGRDNLTKLELVENSGFTGGIETNHQDTHLLLSP